jgi:hypothetical protein
MNEMLFVEPPLTKDVLAVLADLGRKFAFSRLEFAPEARQ